MNVLTLAAPEEILADLCETKARFRMHSLPWPWCNGTYEVSKYEDGTATLRIVDPSEYQGENI